MPEHEIYMRRCLELAELGIGSVSPNPMVGAVIVLDDKIIGEGYHQKYGETHAEVNAVNQVISKFDNYVDLLKDQPYMFRLNLARITVKRHPVPI
jgi:diaminohydroxyphosphoribosylaminopyrimidine deaminase / 5-amino-6-(5-phosphoribosylamino)uracil reductase